MNTKRSSNTQTHAKMKTEHTQGPWTLSRNGRDDMRVFAETVGDSPRAICRINEPLGRLLEANANGVLIAEAPNLLATLQILQQLLGNVDHSVGNGPNAAKMRGHKLNDIRDIITPAIARAEGRAET